MGAYVVRRLLWGAFTVWLISVITFCIFFVIPTGDPAQRIAGKNATPELIEQINEKFHFNDSLPTQYVSLMKQLLSGDLPSFTMGINVVPLVLHGLPVTMSLAFFAALFWLAIGITFGIKGARAPGSRLDRSLMVLALAGISLPMAWLSLLSLKLWTDTIPIFPAGDYQSIAEGGIFGWAYHLLLPAGTLSIVFAGIYARMSRTNIRQAMAEDHVKTAISKGLPERHVFAHHVLRIGLIPILVMLGLDFGVLLGGAIFTETIFGLPGLGSVFAVGISTLDIPVLLTCTIVAATFVVVANLIVDVIQAAIDPRIRLD